MQKVFSALIIVCCLQANSQKLVSMKYGSMLQPDGLRKDLSVLASPEMEGRETGKPGQRRAAAYIESRMKEIGLTPPTSLNGYQQYYNLLRDSLIKASFSWNTYVAGYGDDFIMPVAQNNSADIRADRAIFLGYGIMDKLYNDYSNISRIDNSIAIILTGEPKSNGRYLLTGTDKPSEWTSLGLQKKLEMAHFMGASAVIVINPGQESFSERSIEHSRKSNRFPKNTNDAPVINHLQISHATARKIMTTEFADSIIREGQGFKPFVRTEEEITTGSFSLPCRIEMKKQTDTIKPSNVMGVLEGSDKKDEYVFLTAHYDHLGVQDGKIYYGADDDGSGTAAILQIAEIFSKARADGNGPSRSLVFMAVSGEEKGLLGSEYYSNNPIFPLEKTSVDLNIDMIGRIDTERKLPDTNNYVYLIGHDKMSSELNDISIKSNASCCGMTLDYKFDDPKDPNRIFFRSDHYNFAKKGVPILFYYDGMLKADYHKPTDTIDKINWELFAKRTRLVFHTAWEIAGKQNMLTRDLPLPAMTR
jgi:hypothetical protein